MLSRITFLSLYLNLNNLERREEKNKRMWKGDLQPGKKNKRQEGDYQCSQAASPIRLGVESGWPGLFWGPVFRANLTGPGGTTDICRLSSDKI